MSQERSKIQLEAEHLQIVSDILMPYQTKLTFKVFGSRAKHTARPLSDLDILVEGPASKVDIANIREAFDESDLPFKVDVVERSTTDENFYSNIMQDLVEL